MELSTQREATRMTLLFFKWCFYSNCPWHSATAVSLRKETSSATQLPYAFQMLQNSNVFWFLQFLLLMSDIARSLLKKQLFFYIIYYFYTVILIYCRSENKQLVASSIFSFNSSKNQCDVGTGVVGVVLAHTSGMRQSRTPGIKESFKKFTLSWTRRCIPKDLVNK
jgi:hypothetical protein